VAGEFRWSERSTVSYVSQRNALDDGVPSRVRDFVAGGLDVGWSFLKWRHGDSGLIRSAMEETKCAHLADEQFMNLSEGQKGRARIARSLVASPSVLVLDEPTSALDSETETAILDTLSHLRRARGLTLLVVSHHTNVFANRATHAVFVDSDRGEVIVGTFDEVVRIRVLLPPDDPAPVAPPATPRSN
jgi:ABC-type Mn2+/Zn2+ transport system ATPase subunit